MTYLDWGCEPLAAECQSCLDAICNACNEEFGKRPGDHEDTGGDDRACPDAYEPDCDRCELAKKPDCAHCEIILEVCRNCSENKACEFRISE
jgi:hypothetical protein